MVVLDLFLFERYGLDEKENNIQVLKNALDDKEAALKKKCNSNNDTIRGKARKDLDNLIRDKEILLNENARNKYLKDYYKKVEEIVNYINNRSNKDEAFVKCELTYGISSEKAKQLYEKYNSDNSKSGDLSDIYDLAYKMVGVYNAYSELISSCEPSVKESFASKGKNVDTLCDALEVFNCVSAKEIEDKADELSDIAYRLYDAGLLPPGIKDNFTTVFVRNSTGVKTVASFVNDPNFEKYFSANSWILLRYIKTACILMERTNRISNEEIRAIPPSDRVPFAKTMNQVFGVSFEPIHSDTENETDNKVPVPEEVSQGEQQLQSSNFPEATALFSKAIEASPYCWQGHWGLFKASVKARTDNDIYFSGFLKSVADSSRQQNYPDYVDHYKNAKQYAAYQNSTEINFPAIEMEYKRADSMAYSVIGKVGKIKADYESGSCDSIKSKDGKAVVAQLLKNIDEYDRQIDIGGSSLTPNVVLILSGVLLSVIATFGILINANVVNDFIVFSCGIAGAFILGVVLGGICYYKKQSTPLGIFVGVVSTFALFCIVVFGLEGTVLTTVIYFSAGGLLIAAGLYRVYRVFAADKKRKSLCRSQEELISKLNECFRSDIDVLKSEPLYAKYKLHIPVPSLNASEYMLDEPE